MSSFLRKLGALGQTLVRPALCLVPPAHIQFEPSSRCNMNCVHCEHDKNRKNPKDASLNQLVSIIEGFQPSYITLNGYGEPLLCEELPDMIAYARNKKILVNTTTNGLLLGKYAEKLIESGLNLLNVSLDAATPKTFNAIRRSNRFEEIVSNINRFDSVRKNRRNPVTLRLSMVVQPENIHELSDFIRLSESLNADAVLFQLVETGFFSYRSKSFVEGFTKTRVKKALNDCFQLAQKVAMPSNLSWIITHLDLIWSHFIEGPGDLRRNCWKPWHSIYITADNQMRLCCNFVTDTLNMSTFDIENPLSSFNSKSFIDFRKKLGSGSRPLPPCRYCVPETLPEMFRRKKF